MLSESERRKMMRAMGALLTVAEEVFGSDDEPKVTKIEGDRFRAWLYRPSGPGSEQIHLEFKVGEHLAA